MGTYLIPGATRVDEVVAWRAEPTAGESWALTQDGIVYTAPDVDDVGAAARYEGFAPAAVWPPLPGDLATHAAHIRDYGGLADVDLELLTSLQVRHTLRDVCRALALLVDRRLG